MPSLNHSRRAPPPAPLIRVFDPKGEETESKMDSSSSDWTLQSLNEPQQSHTEEVVRPNKGPYFQMRVKWLKRVKSQKRDSLPVSVTSTRGSLREQVPHSALGEEGEWLNHAEVKENPINNQSGEEIEDGNEDENGNAECKRTSQWIVELSDTGNDLGEVLLFFQSDKEPGRQSLVD